MSEIREKLGIAKIAFTNMDINIDAKKVISSIFDIIEEDKENIIKANEIDVKNDNGFGLDFNIIHRIQSEVSETQDSYRKVISMFKNENNYFEGKQTDNLGTICLIYSGNTYCMLELIIKSILTHNSIIITSDSNYMKATNELIIILVQRILESYKLDKNLIQLLYTTNFEELLQNSTSINKVIAIGNKDLQEKVKKISRIEVICNGYDNYDIYIEDNTNLKFVQEIIANTKNINIYVKTGIKVQFDDYMEVQDLDEAIAQINSNTSGYSASIFTDNGKNASNFLREVKTENISVNSSPLMKTTLKFDLNYLLLEKTMLYPYIFAEGDEKSKFEFATEEKIIEDKKNNEYNQKIEKLTKESEEIKKISELKLKQKEIELNDLKRQLSESQTVANKYMNVFRKSFLSRFFGKIKKEEIERDTKMLP